MHQLRVTQKNSELMRRLSSRAHCHQMMPPTQYLFVSLHACNKSIYMSFMGNYQEAFFLAIVVQGQETKRVCIRLISFLISFAQILVFVDFCLRTGQYLISFDCKWNKLNMLGGIWHCNLFVH